VQPAPQWRVESIVRCHEERFPSTVIFMPFIPAMPGMIASSIGLAPSGPTVFGIGAWLRELSLFCWPFRMERACSTGMAGMAVWGRCPAGALPEAVSQRPPRCSVRLASSGYVVRSLSADAAVGPALGSVSLSFGPQSVCGRMG